MQLMKGKTFKKKIIKDKDPKNIFNVDETGLFYKCIPNKTLVLKEETCSGSKQHATSLVVANMEGCEKLP